MMRYGPGGNLATYAEEQKKRGRKADARTVKRVARAFRPYRFQVALVLTAILLTTLLGLVNPILIAHVFDDAILKGNETLLLIYFAIMIVVPILSGFIGVGQNYLNNKVGQRVMADFRNQLYQHLQSLPLSFFTGTRTGEIQSRLSNDVGGVQGVVTNTATNLFANLSSVLSVIFAMAIISPLLTLISLSGLPLFLWVTYRVGNVRRKMSKETQKSLASLSALMQETLSVSGILLVKVFGQQQYAQAQFQKENEKLTDLALRQLILGRWFFMIIGVFFSIMPALIYLAAGSQIIHHVSVLGGTMSLGTIIAFTALQGRLFFPIGQLLTMQVEIQGAFALFDRIFEYLDLPIDITDKPDALQLKPEMVHGEVTFKDVTFTYKRDAYSILTDLNKEEKQDQDKKKHLVPLQSNAASPTSPEEPRPVLKHISFTIKPGQLVALVGPSGAGKTTITYMVPRLYDVESGAVEIDGVNVKDIPQASLGELIGVVTQEAYLFHASVRENILYARPDATEAEMVAAAQAAAIHERIMELDDGYDTIVGERGYKLSGGEKQRVAIARVVLKNPRILILDEATSSLDTHSERLVQASLETLMKSRTTLAIAHRLSTILAADVILVVNKGEIVERGTHQQLLAFNGLYAQLYNEQFSRMKSVEDLARTEDNVLVSAHGDGARLLSDSLPTTQTVPAFETQTPYLQLLEAMLQKTVSSTPQPPMEITNEMPALSTADLFPSVSLENPDFMQKTRPEMRSRPCLFITSPKLNNEDAAAYEVPLVKDTITLGEADSNDIVLRRDYMTAPYHALLKQQDGDYYLFERCCKGGVFVNRQKLVSGLGYKLADGDQIAIGQYRLIFSTNTPTQKLTKSMVSTAISKRVTLPKMLTLPAKRKS